MKTTPELLGEEMLRTMNRWRELRREPLQLPPAVPPKPKWTIAIGRQHGTGADAVAHKLAEQLGWQVYGRHLVDKIVEDKVAGDELIASADERRSTFLIECLQAFAKAPVASSAAYAHRLAEVLVSLAAHGQCIIVGRGAAFLLPPETTLRVFLVAPLWDRVARIAREQQLTEQAAAKQVKTVDRERAEFIKSHFHKDVSEVEQYDLVLNTARLNESQCAALIAETLRQKCGA